MIKRILSIKQGGFTLIELMIASVIFSVILLLCTAAMLQIGRVYYKGVNSSKTQATTRAIMDEVGYDIQFSGGLVSGSSDSSKTNGAFCAGNKRYIYKLNRMVVDGTPDSDVDKHEDNHGLMVKNNASSCTSSESDDAEFNEAEYKELMSPKMRLLKLTVQKASTLSNGSDSNLWRIVIRTAFGDSDLLESSTGAILDNANFPDARCKSSRVGGQFCAISELDTVIQKRL